MATLILDSEQKYTQPPEKKAIWQFTIGIDILRVQSDLCVLTFTAHNAFLFSFGEIKVDYTHVQKADL